MDFDKLVFCMYMASALLLGLALAFQLWIPAALFFISTVIILFVMSPSEDDEDGSV